MSRILLMMLIAAPAAFILDLTGADPTLVFIVSAVGLIPLASLIGQSTEELAHYTGPRLGGLLNATLGNAAELIITIIAIRAGLLDLVKASITGSILGNLLLVLGLSLVAGGVRNGVQTFDRRQAGLNATLLVLAVVVLLIPSFFDRALIDTPTRELLFNEGVAVVIIVIYALTVIYGFTAKTGAHDPHETVPATPAAPDPTPTVTTTDPATGAVADVPAPGAIVRPAVEVHTARWTVQFSVIVLLAATVGTAILSETLIGAVEPVVQALGLTEFFLGIVLIPLVGNVAEHLVAVQVAYKNKMELSLAVSLGSSLQIALFVAPLLVFISLAFGQRLLLVFNDFELIALASSSLIASLIALDGESNWLEGAMLLAVYIILGLAFFFMPEAAVAVH